MAGIAGAGKFSASSLNQGWQGSRPGEVTGSGYLQPTSCFD
ncbi:hypothetical protein [Mariniphaga sediminis]|nr:hypothetical protein [Mariniphaga sediminis]